MSIRQCVEGVRTPDLDMDLSLIGKHFYCESLLGFADFDEAYARFTYIEPWEFEK